MTPLTISPSERLSYRLMDGGDGGLLFDLEQDPEVMHFLNDGKPILREEIDGYIIPRMLAFTDPLSGCGFWGLFDRTSDDYLGWIVAREYGFDTDYHTPEVLEVGWCLKRYCWGKGLATEAAQAVMAVVAGQPRFSRVCAVADADNLGSIAVMKKLGMQYVDDRMHCTPKGDYPVVYYEMPALG